MSTNIGSFLCLYVAVVPLSNVVSYTWGTLLSVTFVPSIFVIYFLNAKSNSKGVFSIFINGWASPAVADAYSVKVFLCFTLLFAYSLAFDLAVSIKYLYNFSAWFCLAFPALLFGLSFVGLYPDKFV